MDKSNPQPKSLGDYRVPETREEAIKAHIANLGETARQVSDKIGFGADTSDLSRVLEANAEDGDNNSAR